MGWVPDAVIDKMRTSHTLGVFWRLGTDPALHLWMGVNDVPIMIDSVDDSGTIYMGAGRLLNVPALEVLINGLADRVDFQLSGVLPEHISQIEEEAPPVRGRPVHVGITTLDDRWQPMTPIIPLWRGQADYWSATYQPARGTDSAQRVLALSVGTGDTSRSRAARSMWTSAQHKTKFPTDLFFDGMARLARGVEPVFPRF